MNSKMSNVGRKFSSRNNLISMAIYFGFYFVFVVVSFFNASYVITSLAYSNIARDNLEVTATLLKDYSDSASIYTGYAFSISLFIAVFLMLFISRLIDKRKATAKNVILISFLIALISFIVLMFSSSYFLLIAFTINGAVLYALPSFLDTLVLEDIDEQDYSFVRSFGSFGAAISYFFSAFIVLGDSFDIIAVICIIILLIISFILYRYVDDVISEKVEYKDGMKQLASTRNILLMFIIAFLTYGVIRADDSFANYYATDVVGLSPLYIAVVGLLSIVFEGFVMNIYTSLRRVFKLKTLLLIAIFVLIFIFYTKYKFYDNAFLVSFGNILFGIYVGFFVPIMIHVISKFGSLKNQSTLLSIYQVCVLMGGFFLGLITTAIFNITGFLPDIYLLHTIIVIISLAFVFLLKDID